MADSPPFPFPDAGGGHGVAPDRGPTKPRRHRRVRVFRTIAIGLILLFIAAQVAGGGSRGAGRAASGAPAKSHLDEARGHFNAILHLFD